jgi:choline dehydrogenase-like flavoprotein
VTPHLAAGSGRAPFPYGDPPTPEQTAREYDVCIIGSGAAGSMAARELVDAGLEVLVLEQGPFVRHGVTYDELLRASEPAYGRMANGCWGLVGYPWSTCNVGGGTVFYGGASFRYRAVDFDASDHLPDADLPVKWPYGYEELAPFYDEVERILEVAADPSGDPTMPPNSQTGYLPPVPLSIPGELLWDAARRLGLHPFPTPMAIRTSDSSGGAACDRCGPCIEQACETGAKRDAFSAVIKPLLEHPGFHLFAGMRAVELRRRCRDRVAEVQALRADSGEGFTFRARWFIVAANAIQSAALLLRSCDSWSPTGIGNEHDMVGRGLCFKLNEYVSGFVNSASGNEPAVRRGGPFSTLTVLDHYQDDDCPTGLGGLIYESQHGFRYAMRRGAGEVLRVECMLPDQPSRENRIHLARETDARGLPHIVIDYRAHPRDGARLEYMVERCCEILRAAGCNWLQREPTDYHLGSCHLHGTCRGSDDPRTGVLDRWSRVHTVDNLFVVDGAFMPFPSGLNPTLTIQAHALRTARHLAESRR